MGLPRGPGPSRASDPCGGVGGAVQRLCTSQRRGELPRALTGKGPCPIGAREDIPVAAASRPFPAPTSPKAPYASEEGFVYQGLRAHG